MVASVSTSHHISEAKRWPDDDQVVEVEMVGHFVVPDDIQVVNGNVLVLIGTPKEGQPIIPVVAVMNSEQMPGPTFAEIVQGLAESAKQGKLGGIKDPRIAGTVILTLESRRKEYGYLDFIINGVGAISQSQYATDGTKPSPIVLVYNRTDAKKWINYFLGRGPKP